MELKKNRWAWEIQRTAVQCINWQPAGWARRSTACRNCETRE